MAGIRWSWELPDCSMPIAIDTYSRCSYNCLYCFSFFKPMFRRKEKEISMLSPDGVMKHFDGSRESVFSPFLEKKMFVQWGGITDPFDEYERKYGKTLELMKKLKELDYPLSFSTKGTWWTQDKRYTDLIKDQKNWYFKISIINLNAELSAKIELGAPSPQERIRALERIAKLNCGYPILRLRPYIIGMSNKNGEDLKLIRQAGKAGAKAISTEFMCLDQRMNDRLEKRMNQLSEALGFNIMRFYRKNSVGDGYLRLSRENKRDIVMGMKAEAEAQGMKFYCSDAHWKDTNCNGSCCGLPKSANYFKAQMTEMIVKAREQGKISWEDFKAEMPAEYKTMKFVDLEGINLGSLQGKATKINMTTEDWLREKWNSINSKAGLLKAYARVLEPIGSKKGNVVYKYRGIKK